MNKFNKSNDRNQFCIDYGSKLNTANGPAQNSVQRNVASPKPTEVVRNIPIKIEAKEPEKEEEEVIELEAEEEVEESSEESEESESEEESEEGELFE